ISKDELRPWFPVHRVLPGMFSTACRLFGVDLREGAEFERSHAEARLFEGDEGGMDEGGAFLDLYARSNKRGGAWMDGARDRRRLPGGEVQLPVAYLVCNFTPAVGDRPALLTHDEVTTLFHEFGHGLHHLLTRVDYPAASG